MILGARGVGGRDRVAAAGKIESRGENRARRQRFAGGAAHLERAHDGVRRADPNQFTRRGDESREVDAEDVLANRQLVDDEAAVDVRDGHRGARAEHGDHRARKRAAAFVADGALDAPEHHPRRLHDGPVDPLVHRRLRVRQRARHPDDSRRCYDRVEASHAVLFCFITPRSTR